MAAAAEERGVPTLVRFFGVELAEELAAEGRQADLLLGNNVLAQVPDLNDFVAGMKILLAPTGVLTMEFPHVLRLIEENQFDTIYHEHFGYFSLHTTRAIFRHHGLSSSTSRRSPRTAARCGSTPATTRTTPSPSSAAVAELLAREEAFGLTDVERYERSPSRSRRPSATCWSC